MRTIKEMNKLEKEGARSFLKKEGWNPCALYSAGVSKGTHAWSKKVGSKSISIPEDEIRFDED